MRAEETEFGTEIDTERPDDQARNAEAGRIALGISIEFGSHEEAKLIPPPADTERRES